MCSQEQAGQETKYKPSKEIRVEEIPSLDQNENNMNQDNINILDIKDDTSIFSVLPTYEELKAQDQKHVPGLDDAGIDLSVLQQYLLPKD